MDEKAPPEVRDKRHVSFEDWVKEHLPQTDERPGGDGAPGTVRPPHSPREEDRQDGMPSPPRPEEQTKLIRLAVMARELLGEVRSVTLDESSRRGLQEIYERTVAELRDVLPEELRHELESVAIPLDDTASEAELRLAQAQLVGWLDGLFQGIRAAMIAEQAMGQFERQRGRPVPAEMPAPGPGQYL